MVPAMEDGADQNIAQRTKSPVQVRMHHAAGDDIERPQHQKDVGRDAGQQPEHIHRRLFQHQVDGMPARRRGPVDIGGGVMHGVVFPQHAAMKAAVNPVEGEIRAHQVDQALLPQGQARQPAMAVQVEVGDLLAIGDVEYPHGQEHRQPDADIAGEDRREDPVAQVGAQAALLPPRPTRVAGREVRQGAEHHRHPDKPGQHLPEAVQLFRDELHRKLHATCSRGRW